MKEEDIERVKTSIKEHGYEINYELELPVNHAIIAKKDTQSYFIKTRHQDDKLFNVSQTELDAYKYLSKGTARIPTFVEHWIISGNPDIFVMVFKAVDGKSLNSYSNKNMGEEWWNKIIGQIISFVTFLESNRISHNDFHDNNVIVTGKNNDELIFIDFEFMHQYRKNSAIISSVIMDYDKNKDEIDYMKDCGFVKRFVRGKDLNLILASILHEQTYLPEKWKKRINKYLKSRVSSNGIRIYRIIKSNLNPFP